MMLSKRSGSRPRAIRDATVSAPAVLRASTTVRTQSFSGPFLPDSGCEFAM
jgi:hypothetical protein